HGFPPTPILFEVGGEEGQTVARLGSSLLQQGPHLCLALEASNRRANLMPTRQKLQDAMAADESRAAGHQNCAHHISSIDTACVGRGDFAELRLTKCLPRPLCPGPTSNRMHPHPAHWRAQYPSLTLRVRAVTPVEAQAAARTLDSLRYQRREVEV